MELNKEQKIFLAGFRASSEGFNGEYPFYEDCSNEQVWENIKYRFKEVSNK